MTGKLNISLFLHLIDTQKRTFYSEADDCLSRANKASTDGEKWVWNAKSEAYKDAGRQLFVLGRLLDRE